MDISFNANVKLLTGGHFQGGSNWNKYANDIDKCYKIYFFREGEAFINSCEKKWLLKPSFVYFINGFKIESQNCPEFMDVDWLHFLPDSVYFDHVLRNSSCVVSLKSNAFLSFVDLFQNISKYFDGRFSVNEERIYKIKIQSLIQFVIAEVLKTSDFRLLEQDEEFNRLLPALEFINNNYKQKINLKDMAEQCYLSPNYFHRLFTGTFHISPLTYVQRMRMEDAARQLVYTNKLVKEIAFSIGFNDEAYFSRIFSNYYNTSPGRFRAMNRRKMP